MLAVVCQAIFFDFFLENPGFLEKGVPWRVDVQFYVSPFPPLPVPPGDRAEPLVDVVLDRDSRKRRDGQRDHGRSVGLAKWSNDDAHLHLSPGFEDPSWPVESASTSWHVVMGSVERDRPQEPHFCHVSCSICHAHLSIMLFARASKVRIGSLWPVESASTSWYVVMGSVERDRPQEPHFCHVSCSICHAHLSIMLFARASKVRIGSLPVAEIMVGMNPTGRWSVATHLIVGVSYSCPHCQVLLEVPDKPWRGWVLCPDCGLPCLPPERLTLPHSRKRSVARQPRVPQDLVPEQTGPRKEPAPMVKPSVPRARQSTSSSATRLIVSTGLFVSAILLLVAYLDRSSHSLAIFGTLTVIFLILLLRMPRRR